MKQLIGGDSGVEIVWRAFELRPDPVPTLPPAGDYLERAWRQSVYPMAAGMGVVMRLPPVQPRTRLAHQAARWARGEQRFEDYHEALFTAFFERGEDIGRIPILTAIASSLGLDSDSLEEALRNRDLEPQVLEDEGLAAGFGLRGVPAFVADRVIAASGVQPVGELQRLVAEARRLKG